MSSRVDTDDLRPVLLLSSPLPLSPSRSSEVFRAVRPVPQRRGTVMSSSSSGGGSVSERTEPSSGFLNRRVSVGSSRVSPEDAPSSGSSPGRVRDVIVKSPSSIISPSSRDGIVASPATIAAASQQQAKLLRKPPANIGGSYFKRLDAVADDVELSGVGARGPRVSRGREGSFPDIFMGGSPTDNEDPVRLQEEDVLRGKLIDLQLAMLFSSKLEVTKMDERGAKADAEPIHEGRGGGGGGGGGGEGGLGGQEEPPPSSGIVTAHSASGSNSPKSRPKLLLGFHPFANKNRSPHGGSRFVMPTDYIGAHEGAADGLELEDKSASQDEAHLLFNKVYGDHPISSDASSTPLLPLEFPLEAVELLAWLCPLFNSIFKVHTSEELASLMSLNEADVSTDFQNVTVEKALEIGKRYAGIIRANKTPEAAIQLLVDHYHIIDALSHVPAFNTFLTEIFVYIKARQTGFGNYLRMFFGASITTIDMITVSPTQLSPPEPGPSTSNPNHTLYHTLSLASLRSPRRTVSW